VNKIYYENYFSKSLAGVGCKTGSTGTAGMTDYFVSNNLQNVTFSAINDMFGAQK